MPDSTSRLSWDHYGGSPSGNCRPTECGQIQHFQLAGRSTSGHRGRHGRGNAGPVVTTDRVRRGVFRAIRHGGDRHGRCRSPDEPGRGIDRGRDRRGRPPAAGCRHAQRYHSLGRGGGRAVAPRWQTDSLPGEQDRRQQVRFAGGRVPPVGARHTGQGERAPEAQQGPVARFDSAAASGRLRLRRRRRTGNEGRDGRPAQRGQEHSDQRAARIRADDCQRGPGDHA